MSTNKEEYNDLPPLNDGGYAHGPADSYDIPNYDFADKVALVTGASQGIGRHVAFALARCGAKVIVSSRSQGGVETVDMISNDELSKKAGGQGYFIKCDVSKENEVQSMVNETLEKFGALHFAVNNAGHSGINNLVEDQSGENFDDVFNTNVKGSLFCMKAEIKAMRRNEPSAKRKNTGAEYAGPGTTMKRSGYGRIVNIGSAAAFIGFPRAGMYIASKHALMGLTQTAAIELAADTDIRVNMVVPGSVKTHNYELFTEGSEEMKAGMIAAHCTKQILMPEDVVGATLFLCSDAAFFSVGAAFNIDGGYMTQ
ncbi:SDR family oxidoreductase [Aureibacter tunicatorum]|uniref:NAD(P)-dependent dehydrogenase (Short-subunit alcohol dehydrogenase family) n=1 Tax=Aureibacter tunicatorum TaxID=866807 RepID=A0AAE3XNY3_9BACT|nr:SDR family oxidoreductase [Aureibacter tunicatorum]MDR6241401.1 NAD(P)-dependent dehydrogenase (short-subunit alcohol dehydrogenase family) [Aureibacter tunicatorum]BDD06754.1 short chain dehydrogenase [Aureibacter tunicatorum]